MARKLQDQMSPAKGETRLEDGYQPHPFDVISRRDREFIPHEGNNRFQFLVDLRVDSYASALTRFQKTKIIREIVDAVRNSGGRFIRQEGTVTEENVKAGMIGMKQDGSVGSQKEVRYYVVCDKKAADKVGHAMRLALSKRQSGSHKGKCCPPRSSTPKPEVNRHATVPETIKRVNVETQGQGSNVSSRVLGSSIRNAVTQQRAALKKLAYYKRWSAHLKSLAEMKQILVTDVYRHGNVPIVGRLGRLMRNREFERALLKGYEKSIPRPCDAEVCLVPALGANDLCTQIHGYRVAPSLIRSTQQFAPITSNTGLRVYDDNVFWSFTQAISYHPPSGIM